jgi:hypothetical protein
LKDDVLDLTTAVAPSGAQIAVLLQLDRMGTEFEVPLLLMNYDSFYDNMLKYLDDCVDYGATHTHAVLYYCPHTLPSPTSALPVT